MTDSKLVYIDTETCGLHGMAILIQWAEEDGPIHLHDVWKAPVQETLDLINYFCDNIFIGFNTAFDWFHLTKIHTTWNLLNPKWIPEEHIDEIAEFEKQARDEKCIKPFSTFDLMLYSRKGPYQSLMARKEIRVKKIPIALAQPLADLLENLVELDGIYFAKTVDKNAPRWKVLDIISKNDVVNLDFKDVVLKFNAAGGLKYLAEYALGRKPNAHISDIGVPDEYLPYELGYAPYAKALASAPDWICKNPGGPTYRGRIARTWPALIQLHIHHWAHNKEAREYAYNDVVYTRDLYKHFNCPEPGDTDSVLACMVASVRWRGYMYNREGLEALQQESKQILDAAPININKHRDVFAYVSEVMDLTEIIVIEDSTRKANMEQVAAWVIEEPEDCISCFGGDDDIGVPCKRCNGTGQLQVGLHPAAVRAKDILKIKVAGKEVELFNKLLLTDRFHASFKVIGTLSSRMSGADGLNAQGIKHDKNVRKQFPLMWPGAVLCGGDFDSFEVTIADAVFNDEKLHETLLADKKFHGLLGVELFPDYTYEEILASDGEELDWYSKSKQGTFGFLYGGDAGTWEKNLGVSKVRAEKAFDNFCKKYPGIGKSRDKITDDFCSMRQEGGIGSAVVWKTPKDYCETFLGFKRYFTLENTICEILFNLASSLPIEWKNLDTIVVRRDREQTAAGAVSSALYGAAFQIQAANMRAANNHLIQSPGAEITKDVQRKIWDLQPPGVHDMFVAPMNIHDEVMCVTHPEYVDKVADAVKDSVESYRKYVPLIGMKWNLEMDNWAEKKSSSRQIHITY